MTVDELAELLVPIGCGPLASRTPINNSVPLVEVCTPCGAVLTRGITVLVLVWSCRGMEGFMIRGWDHCAAGPWRWPEVQLSPCADSMSPSPQPITNPPVGFGFPRRVGHRPVGSPFSSPWGCWICKDLEGFLIRRWDLILPGCGGTSTLARGATLAAHWLNELQPISNHPVGLGFPHRAGRY